MVATGSFDEAMRTFSCVGGARSQEHRGVGRHGKRQTTLPAALSCELLPPERASSPSRIRVELRFLSNPHVVRLSASATRRARARVTIRDLVINALHAPRPYRGGRMPRAEALDMLQASEHRPRRVADHATRELARRRGVAPRDDGSATRWIRWLIAIAERGKRLRGGADGSRWTGRGSVGRGRARVRRRKAAKVRCARCLRGAG